MYWEKLRDLKQKHHTTCSFVCCFFSLKRFVERDSLVVGPSVTFGEDGVQAILKGSGGSNPILEYLPDGFIIEEGVDVFTSGKDGIFYPGSPIGKTTVDKEVKLFSESSQLSFVKVDISNQLKEAF